MALLSKEKARNIARMVKKEEDYIIEVLTDKHYKNIGVKVYPSSLISRRITNKGTKSVKVNEPIFIYSKDLKAKFPNASTLSEWEEIIYTVVNSTIEERKAKLEGDKKGVNASQEPEIYVSNVGYNSVRFRFYVKVRETEKSIWFQQVDKINIGGDWQNPLVKPNLDVQLGEVFRRLKGNGSTKIGDYEYVTVWNGDALQELSD